MRTILLVDDEPAARYGTRRALEGKYRIVEAGSANKAREAIASEHPDLILLDLVMPEEDGLSFLRRLRESGNEIPILVVSALDTAKTAVEALQAGAADYIVKGFDIEELRTRVANILKLAELGVENRRLRQELVAEGQFGRMLGASAAMRRVFEMAERVAPTDTTVLILGESGSGKDLLAQEIHERSPRATKPFVAVNCAALPESLIESELFGYERGAFTGAAQQRKGKFELATGGTIFLAGRFREDLYYRLRVVSLELPPLRAHKEDLALLAASFLEQLGARHSRRVRLSHEAMELLRRYDWPGNVRELRNALERTLVLARGEEITAADLPEEIRQGTGSVGSARNSGSDSYLGEADFREAKRKFEIAYLKRKLEEHHWNVSKTAAEVGLHRQSLQEKLRELGIQRPGK